LINQIDNTEEKVLEAARIVFQKKGFSGARMEEIAKTAGVNKALLNYYYRSKDKLFKKVFEASFRELLSAVVHVLQTDIPLDMKVYKVVDIYTRMLLKNKSLPLFIFGEIHENPDRAVDLFKGDLQKVLEVLGRQLEEAYQNGYIKKISVPEFMLNLLSLTIFPFIVEPVLRNVVGLDEKAYNTMLKERSKIIPSMIIDSLKVKS
jgi:AcrR family transcriptional regulator